MNSQIHQRISDGDPDRLDQLVVIRFHIMVLALDLNIKREFKYPESTLIPLVSHITALLP